MMKDVVPCRNKLMSHSVDRPKINVFHAWSHHEIILVKHRPLGDYSRRMQRWAATLQHESIRNQYAGSIACQSD